MFGVYFCMICMCHRTLVQSLIENIGIDTCMLVLGAIEQDIWAKLWSFEFNMAATRGRKCLGLFLMVCMNHRTLVQSFMLSSKTARFW